MGIDFSAAANAETYSCRTAHRTWTEAIRRLLDPTGTHVVDIGCGGGIYSRAWLEMGAASVTGIDSSGPILAAAIAEVDDVQARFELGDALATGLPADSADVVFSRALVHHLSDLTAFAREAVRIARPGGHIIIQDRTMTDITQPASPEHIRGHFFELFPRLLGAERARRPDEAQLAYALQSASGYPVEIQRLWEVRAIHETHEGLLHEIRSRKGRSLLHELNDVELESLTAHIAEQLPASGIHEIDRWTLWTTRV